MAKYECDNCGWKGDELTKRAKLPSGVQQMIDCCIICGESIIQKKLIGK